MCAIQTIIKLGTKVDRGFFFFTPLAHAKHSDSHLAYFSVCVSLL